MSQDILEQIQAFHSGDIARSARLASTLHWRRLELIVLGEILADLRKLNQKLGAG